MQLLTMVAKGKKDHEDLEEDSDVKDETNIADDNTESDVGQVERIYFDGVEVTDDQSNNNSRDDQEVEDEYDQREADE